MGWIAIYRTTLLREGLEGCAKQGHPRELQNGNLSNYKIKLVLTGSLIRTITDNCEPIVNEQPNKNLLTANTLHASIFYTLFISQGFR